MPATIHLSDFSGGRAPRLLRRVADRMGRVVAAVTAAPAGAYVATDQPCSTRWCRGTLWAERAAAAVAWCCPHCGRTGRVMGWQGGRWDRRADSAEPPAAAPLPTALCAR